MGVRPAPKPCHLLLLACLASWTTTASATACAPGQALTLLHFNDFHGQIEPYRDPIDGTERGGIARLAARVDAVRAEEPGRPLLLLFAGDLLQGTLTSSLFLGLPDVVLFDRMGVDAAVLGNHELDYGQPVLRRLAAEARFPILSANVTAHPTPLPVLPDISLRPSPHGPIVTILGLTTPDLATGTHPRHLEGISVEDPIAVARERVPALRKRSALMIILSHLGIAEDRRLAQDVPGIDLIVGGHNHVIHREPLFEGGVPILQVGERGGWLGRMDLECRDGRLAQSRYQVIDIDSASPEDSAIASEVARIVQDAEQALNEEVGLTTRTLSAQREIMRRQESAFGDFVADLARRITLADVALLNGGGFRASIPAGPVTLKAIYEAFPFRNELVVGELTGEQLRAALARSAALDPLQNPGGFLQVSGVRYVIRDGALATVTVGDAAIDLDRTYRVVTTDFLAAGGDGYWILKDLRDRTDTGRLLSDAVIEAFRTESPIDAGTDGRIRRE
jgi:2',3'-cyclic-nucleotide 2'-phosphodiesterase (5'-nucleotidase family)